MKKKENKLIGYVRIRNWKRELKINSEISKEALEALNNYLISHAMDILIRAEEYRNARGIRKRMNMRDINLAINIKHP